MAGPANGRRDMAAPIVGIVGAGQLARMLCEAASALGIRTVVMAEDPARAVVPAAGGLVAGSPWRLEDLAKLAAACDVVTFDHEHVDLTALDALVAGGTAVRPGTETLALTVDKAHMRRRLEGAGIPVPAYCVLPEAPDLARQRLEAFAEHHGWPLVLKACRGGYDGRGVWEVTDPLAAAEVVQRTASAGIALLVEERVAIDVELAALVARTPGGNARAWPPVETVQVEGICREVRYPGSLPPAMAEAATELALEVAQVAGAVGVLAVELFSAQGRLVVNELAARPHNSGHWTMEGSVTSQFENHLRAVLDLPLGDTAATQAQVVMVNVLGGSDRDPASILTGALAVPGAHVHLYGKAPRPGRKLGHVTVYGDDAAAVRQAAREAATALGNPPVLPRPTLAGATR